MVMKIKYLEEETNNNKCLSEGQCFSYTTEIIYYIYIFVANNCMLL